MTPETVSPWIKMLLDFGFTPMNIILIAALWFLGKWALAKDKSQDEKREMAHHETKAEVKKLSGEVTECKNDRRQLNRRLRAAELKIKEVESCHVTDCPLRKK